MSLETDFNLGRDADDLYAELVDAHEGLSEPESAALDARLILILLNHIGDAAVIRAAIAAAAQR
jgi:hypothetical protein